MCAHTTGHSSPARSHTKQSVDVLNGLAQELAGALGITEPGDKNDVLARVLELDALGTSGNHQAGCAAARPRDAVGTLAA